MRNLLLIAFIFSGCAPALGDDQAAVNLDDGKADAVNDSSSPACALTTPVFVGTNDPRRVAPGIGLNIPSQGSLITLSDVTFEPTPQTQDIPARYYAEGISLDLMDIANIPNATGLATSTGALGVVFFPTMPAAADIYDWLGIGAGYGDGYTITHSNSVSHGVYTYRSTVTASFGIETTITVKLKDYMLLSVEGSWHKDVCDAGCKPMPDTETVCVKSATVAHL
jgi:hypothetical protein